ncbi:hypothetical protein ScPMuIL_011720 [Solemya velum]
MTEFLSSTDRNIVVVNAKVNHRNTCGICVKYFNIEKQKLEENGSFQLTFREAFRNVNIVNCQEAVEHASRLRCLFLVLQLVDTEKHFKYYIFALRIDVKKIIPLKQFITTKNLLDLGVYLPTVSNVSDNPTIQSKQIFVVDGPSLVWLQGGKLCSISTVTGSRTDCIVHKYSLAKHNLEKKLSIKYISSRLLWASYVETIYLCIGISEFNSGTVTRTSFFSVSFIPLCEKKLDESNFTSIDVNIFLPEEYSENVTCMKLLNCRKHQNRLFSDTRLYAGTKDGYLMEFVSGRLLRAVAVWNWEPDLVPPVVLEILLCQSYQSSDTFLFIQTDQQEVVALSDGEWKVCEKWRDVQRIFVGDFVENGCDQTLLLRDCKVPALSWVLTDLHTVHIDSSADVVSTASPSTTEASGTVDSTDSAIRALELRLQNEVITLHEEEERVRNQAFFVNKIWNDLKVTAQGLPTNRTVNEPTLVRLIQGTDGTEDNTATKSVLNKLEVLVVWQKTFNDKWIVGVDLLNSTDKCFSSVALSIVPESCGVPFQKEVSSISKCYYQDNQLKKNDMGEPYHQFLKRKRKEPGCIRGDNPNVKIPPKAYTCTEDELHMLVHHLYSCLPDDVLILPDDKEERESALRLTVSQLTEEVQFLYSGTSKLLTEVCKSSQEPAPDQKGDGAAAVGIERIRKQFAAEKSVISSRAGTKLNDESVQKFLSTCKTVQEKTDYYISKLFSKH